MKERTGWSWSLGGSVIASLCCFGPAVAALVGVGGASFLLGLTRYRLPLLIIGLGFALLGVGMALRQSARTCDREQHRRNLWRFPTVTLITFVATYGLLTYVFPVAVYNVLGATSGIREVRSERPAAPAPASPSQLPDDAAPSRSAPAQEALPLSQEGPAPATPTPEAGLRRVTLAVSGMT